MQVLVIGGTNFIGPHVVRRLLAAEHDVTLFHRGESPAPDLDVDHIHGDRRHLADHRDTLRGLAPDVVLDMVMMTEADALGAVDVFEGTPYVMISSMDVYQAYGRFTGFEPGPVIETPLAEDSPLREKLYPYREQAPSEDHWLHDYDKILAEQQIRQLPSTILRLPMVFGPGDRQHRFGGTIKRMLDERPAILLQEDMAAWRMSYGYVENVAHAIALAVIAQQEGVYNVALQDDFTQSEWITLLAQHIDWDGQVITLPREEMPEHLRAPYNYQQDLIADSTRIRQTLDYNETVTLDTALQRTIEWERKHPVASDTLDYAAEDAAIP